MVLWLQYAVYLMVGAFYYLMLSALAAATAGLTIQGLTFFVLSLVLGGYASAGSVVAPGASALLAGLIGSCYLVHGTWLFAAEAAGRFALVLGIPATAVLIVSFVIWRNKPLALWRRHASAGSRAALGVMMLAPLIAATLLILRLPGWRVG